MWNKIKLIDFFNINLKKDIVLEDLDRKFFINGKVENIEELDLCSHTIFEVQILQNILNNEIYITLHENFIGIKFEILTKNIVSESKKKLIKIPYQHIKIACSDIL